jgi:hypothetical protein
MSARRGWLKCLLLAPFALFAGLSSSARAVDPPAVGGRGLQSSFDLKKQLQTGLKARRPQDFTYIDTIVAKVENGTLPQSLVTQAFIFSRQQYSEYPIIYFQFTLKKLAGKAGIAL